jgi:hypothetical protein
MTADYWRQNRTRSLKGLRESGRLITAWAITLAVATVALRLVLTATPKVWAIGWALMAGCVLEAFWFDMYWKSVAVGCVTTPETPRVSALELQPQFVDLPGGDLVLREFELIHPLPCPVHGCELADTEPLGNTGLMHAAARTTESGASCRCRLCQRSARTDAPNEPRLLLARKAFKNHTQSEATPLNGALRQ